MRRPEDRYTYPSKRTEKPDGAFTIRQFILPVQLRGSALWAWLDTGANVSILPKEIATTEIGIHLRGEPDGTYALAGLIEVPYHTRHLSMEILDYIESSIKELNLGPYKSDPSVAVSLTEVEFQIPSLTWSEIADKIDVEAPLTKKSQGLPFVILGLYGVLDQLNLTFVGENAVTISSQL